MTFTQARLFLCLFAYNDSALGQCDGICSGSQLRVAAIKHFGASLDALQVQVRGEAIAGVVLLEVLVETELQGY